MHPRPPSPSPPAAPLPPLAPTVPSRAARADGPGEASCLARYFTEIAAIEVMTADEEIAAATRIAALRQAYWRSLLRHRPQVDALGRLARELLPGAPSLMDLLAAPQTSALEPHQRLAEVLAEVDRDGVLADHVFAGLERAAQGPCTAPGVAVVSDERADALRQLAEARAARRQLGAARGAFVTANLRLVVAIARRYARGSLPLSDLIQEGNLGLIKAVDRYDHRRGFRFATYGSWWIRHAITRAITDKSRAVRLPSHTLRTYNQVTRARRELAAREGQQPDDGDVVRVTGLSAERLHRMNCSLREEVSLSSPHPATDGLTVLDALVDPRTPEVSAMLDRTRMLATLHDVLERLSPMEIDVLRKRVGMDDQEELTLNQIGERYALSRERIRQVQAQAVQKLRAEFKRRHLL